MKKGFFLILILFSGLINAQVEKEKSVYNSENKSTEIFTVSAQDETMKIGLYSVVDSTGNVLLTGYYLNNKKDSTWTSYDLKGNIEYQGTYKRGEPTGEWQYYHDGKLTMRYNFTKDELVQFRSNDSIVDAISMNSNDTTKKLTDHPAIYIGGELFLLSYIRAKVEYPLYAKLNKVQGTLYIGITIDSTGKAINHRVLRAIGGGCDQEAMKIIKSLNYSWIPAVHDGKRVDSNMTIPVSFRLN